MKPAPWLQLVLLGYHLVYYITLAFTLHISDGMIYLWEKKEKHRVMKLHKLSLQIILKGAVLHHLLVNLRQWLYAPICLHGLGVKFWAFLTFCLFLDPNFGVNWQIKWIMKQWSSIFTLVIKLAWFIQVLLMLCPEPIKNLRTHLLGDQQKQMIKTAKFKNQWNSFNTQFHFSGKDKFMQFS